MKLKKIASLMLAGIMAVSMLAGCKGNTINENPGSSSSEPTAPAGYSKMLHEHLSPSAQKSVTPVDSDAVNSALRAAMDFVGGDAISGAYDDNWLDVATVINTTNYSTAPAALKNAAVDLIDSLSAENALHNGVATALDLLDPTPANYNSTNLNVALLFVTNGDKGMDAVMDEVASRINNDLETLVDDYDIDSDGDYDVDYSYNISVSAYTKTLDGDHAKSMTFVAVNVARV